MQLNVGIKRLIQGLIMGTWPRFIATSRLKLRSFKKSFDGAVARNILSSDPILSNLTDKVKVRTYLSSTLGSKYCIPILYACTDADEISKKLLPDECIIKPTHLSGAAIVKKIDLDPQIVNKNLDGVVVLPSSRFHDFKFMLNKIMVSWLQKSHVYFPNKYPEKAYGRIQPRIIVEPLLHQANNIIPADYKFHCYNGKVRFVQVDYNRSNGHNRQFFDSEWNRLDAVVIFPNGNQTFTKPIQLEEMLEVSQKLAYEFELVRVDFLISDEGLFISELSFFPDGGFGKFDKIMTMVKN